MLSSSLQVHLGFGGTVLFLLRAMVQPMAAAPVFWLLDPWFWVAVVKYAHSPGWDFWFPSFGSFHFEELLCKNFIPSSPMYLYVHVVCVFTHVWIHICVHACVGIGLRLMFKVLLYLPSSPPHSLWQGLS